MIPPHQDPAPGSAPADMQAWQARDHAHVWHPCSQMKDYETYPAIIIQRAQGAYLYDMNDKAYLDAISSWWVNLFGHSHPRINQALAKQAERLEHVIFAGFSHAPAIELAERIIALSPPGLSKVFFSDNGSCSVEIALKMSFQYHQQTGAPSKTRFMALTNAYHGETLGALSVGDLDLYSRIYRPLLLDTIKVPGPDCYRCSYGLNRQTCGAPCAQALADLLAQHHQEVCALIIEPLLQCAAGMRIYPACYLAKARALCTHYGVHVIADEIATGFGRTGTMFACEHAAISPDIMCLSKGLSAGYLPLALTLTTDAIYQAFYADYNDLKAFLHSHSYTGNPLGCSVALASLDIFRDEDVLARNARTSAFMAALATELFDGHPFIGEYRQLGMVGAIELVADKAAKQGFDAQKRVGHGVYRLALEKGVLLRPLGNVIYFMPPYVVKEDDIVLMLNTARAAIDAYFA